MKLKTKKKYFDLIKAGTKTYDLRDAHITFINEETGETIQKKVVHCDIITRTRDMFPDVLTEDHVIRFFLESPPEQIANLTK